MGTPKPCSAFIFITQWKVHIGSVVSPVHVNISTLSHISKAIFNLLACGKFITQPPPFINVQPGRSPIASSRAVRAPARSHFVSIAFFFGTHATPPSAGELSVPGGAYYSSQSRTHRGHYRGIITSVSPGDRRSGRCTSLYTASSQGFGSRLFLFFFYPFGVR